MKKILVFILVAIMSILSFNYVYSTTTQNNISGNVNDNFICVINGEELPYSEEICELNKNSNGVSEMNTDYETSDGKRVCLQFLANNDNGDAIDRDTQSLLDADKTKMDESYESYKYLLYQSSGKCNDNNVYVNVVATNDMFIDSNNTFNVSTNEDKIYCQLNYNNEKYNSDGYENCLKFYKDNVK